MQFKVASLADLPDISRIFHSCWQISYLDLLSEKVRIDMTTEAAEDLWRPSLIDPQGRETVMGLDDEHPISVFRIGTDKDSPTRGHLFSIYVSPEHAGKGYGRQTLAEAISRVKSRGFTEMTLWVFANNSRANSMYTKFGFTPTGRTRIDERWQANEMELIKSNL